MMRAYNFHVVARMPFASLRRDCLVAKEDKYGFLKAYKPKKVWVSMLFDAGHSSPASFIVNF